MNRDPAALRNLITAGETTFPTTAANNNALADIFRAFPDFLTQQRLTMASLKAFSTDADPVIKELIPVAQQLGPTLTALKDLSPSLRQLFVKLGPLITASRTGLPATERTLKGLGPNKLLDSVGPFLEQLNPILYWLSLHQQLISDFITGRRRQPVPPHDHVRHRRDGPLPAPVWPHGQRDPVVPVLPRPQQPG